jgi:hypothetical protein
LNALIHCNFFDYICDFRDSGMAVSQDYFLEWFLHITAWTRKALTQGENRVTARFRLHKFKAREAGQKYESAFTQGGYQDTLGLVTSISVKPVFKKFELNSKSLRRLTGACG